MEITDGRYMVDGVDLAALTEQFGAPLYVYNAKKIREKYDSLNNAFSNVESLKLNYACKALTNINVLRLLQSWGSGLDTVSINEVKQGLIAGFNPEDIIFTPSGVSREELSEAASLGVKINIDNLSMLEWFAHEHPEVPVCVRINPHIMAGGNIKISTGHIDSKFGISIYQVPHIVKIVETTGVHINGLHMHTGSDILDIEVFLQGAEILFDVAKNFDRLDYIDFGSGFKVPYKEGDIYTDIDLLGERLGARFNEFQTQYGRDLMLMFEPGKFLVSESGYFLTKVNTIKQTPSSLFAQVDSGFNHLIRPMFYDAFHKIVNISNPEGTPRIYTVTGYICETDTFGADRQLHEVRRNDILCFRNAGAYSFSMASNYNSRLRPAEVLILDGKAHLIRERETFSDLMSKQVEIEFAEA